MFLYFQNKLYEQRKQLLFMANHRPASFKKNIIIKYIKPSKSYAFTSENCYLNLAPVDLKLVVCRISKNSSICIISEAEINDSIWYEVSLPSIDNINNRGWLKSDKILFKELMK